MTGNSNLRGAGMALLAFATYAGSDAVVKWLGGHYSPFQLIFFSQLLAFPLVTLLMIRDRTDGNLRPRHPWWVSLRTGGMVFGGIASFYAFAVLPLAQTYAILFSMPIMITLLSIPVLGERIGLHRGAAIVAGLIGVLIVLRPGAGGFGIGHVAALLGAFGSALSSVVMRRIGQDERSSVMLVYPMLGNVIVMGVALPFVYRPMPLLHMGGLGAIAVLTFLAMLFLVIAYRAGEAAVVAPMQYSQILWAVIFGHLFFHEGVDAATAIGSAVVIASGLYIVLRESRGTTSENRPVLNARARFATGIMPRVGALWPRKKPD